MRNLNHLAKFRVPLHGQWGDSSNGAFLLPNPKKLHKLKLQVIAGSGGGWDHVSVSTKSRCPTWDEMQWVRDLFFDPDELPVQFGIGREGKTQYVNDHQFCLHWWRAHDVVYPLPPLEFV